MVHWGEFRINFLVRFKITMSKKIVQYNKELPLFATKRAVKNSLG